jgi:hypothetical protein
MPAMIGGFGKINNNTIKTSKNELLAKESQITEVNNNSDIISHHSEKSVQVIFNKSKLGPYLAGLIEANGSIAVHDKNTKAKKYRPKILVVFHRDDKPLADRLSLITQTGTVYDKKAANYVI